jgi:hypothetical protein
VTARQLTEFTGGTEIASAGHDSADLTVVFPAGRGVPNWARRNAESPVPGNWPYGLDKLAELGAGVGTAEVAEPGPLARLRRRVVARPRQGEGIALAWDEVTGVRMLSGFPAARRFCGVIWATDQLEDGGPQLAIQRRALRAMDGVWALSRPQVELVRDWLGAAGPPVHFLPFGVDPDFYRESAFPDQPLVASVGGDRDRDPATLFAALEQVIAARPDVSCVVQSKTELPAPAGVSKVARLPHDEVRALFARAQVVALATRPNVHVSGMTVALEAMSAARPVVATETPGMADYVVPGVTGQLTPPGDADAMATRILELLDQPSTAAELGRGGRKHVETAHTTRTMCAALLDIVREN